MKLRFDVDQAAAFRKGVDCPKSIVTVDVDPSKISQPHRNLIADRLKGIDVVRLRASNDTAATPVVGDDPHFPFVRIKTDVPTYDAMLAAVIANDAMVKRQQELLAPLVQNGNALQDDLWDEEGNLNEPRVAKIATSILWEMETRFSFAQKSGTLNVRKGITPEAVEGLLKSIKDTSVPHVLWIDRQGNIHLTPGTEPKDLAEVEMYFEPFLPNAGLFGITAKNSHVMETTEIIKGVWGNGVRGLVKGAWPARAILV